MVEIARRLCMWINDQGKNMHLLDCLRSYIGLSLLPRFQRRICPAHNALPSKHCRASLIPGSIQTPTNTNTTNTKHTPDLERC